LYRDECLLAINKPAGMVVHRGWAEDAVTISDLVRDRIIGAPVFAVHRLDRGTSGVLLFALNADSARLMQAEFQNGGARKTYLALVRGPFRESCVLDHPVPRCKGGERIPAITEFTPLAHSDRWSLVEARPLTGRMHQIRRHLKHLSCPIIGDVRYGKGKINQFFREQYGLTRMALHALEMRIKHPDGRELHLQAPIPDDLSAPLRKLGIWSVSQNETGTKF
jgi:tRNA pseudouridine65 synthase